MFPEWHLKQIVKDNVAEFSYLRGENAYYTVTLCSNPDDPDAIGTEWVVYMFPVPLADLNGASVFAEMKAITLMRWIRKALNDNTFVKTNEKPRRRFNVTYREGGYKVSIPRYDGGAVVEAREIK